jgi:hypothetical protein
MLRQVKETQPEFRNERHTLTHEPTHKNLWADPKRMLLPRVR